MLMINKTTDRVRNLMIPVAKAINKISRGKVSPNMVTLLSFLGHFIIFLAIIDHQFYTAAALLVFFGLMDALDGALAKVQKKTSPTGMLLDATSDRAKEAILYIAFIFVFADSENMVGVMVAALAMSGSFMVSYVKAKGETAIATRGRSHSIVNRKYSTGLMQYQVRMTFIVAALILDILTSVITVIAVLSWLTALIRLLDISESLSENRTTSKAKKGKKTKLGKKTA